MLLGSVAWAGHLLKEDVHRCLKIVRDSWCTFFQEEKTSRHLSDANLFLEWEMCFWLAFSFSQDSRFILSVRISKRNEESSGILFFRCVLRNSRHLLVFLLRRNRSQFFQIYIDGRRLRKHQGFFIGNLICILGGAVVSGERLLS